MTKEDWNNLTENEYFNLSEEDVLRHLIKFSEERYISYKKMLEDSHKDKNKYDSNDFVWLKDHIRDLKNREEGFLKNLRIEVEHYRQGLNRPSFYPY